jgi:hypothetical protein
MPPRQQRRNTPTIRRVVRVCVSGCERLARRRGRGREGGFRVQGRPGGLGAAIKVAGNEGGASLQGGGGFPLGLGLLVTGSSSVEGGVDQWSGLWEGELPLGDAGGETNGFQMRAESAVRVGGRFEEGGVGACSQNIGLENWIERRVGLERHDHAVKAFRHEELGIDLIKERVSPGPRLELLRGAGDGLHGDGDAHGDGIGDEAHGEAGEVDDVEDGGGFGGGIERVEEGEEGGLVDAALAEEGGVGADEAAGFVLRAPLGEDHWHGETLRSRWVGGLRVQVHEVSGVLFHGLRVDLVQGRFAFGVDWRGIVGIIVICRVGRVVEGPCCFVGIEVVFVGAGGIGAVLVIVTVYIGFLLFGYGAGD